MEHCCAAPSLPSEDGALLRGAGVVDGEALDDVAEAALLALGHRERSLLRHGVGALSVDEHAEDGTGRLSGRHGGRGCGRRHCGTNSTKRSSSWKLLC